MPAPNSISFDKLTCIATIVRGADTARLDLAPEAAGFLAALLGLRGCIPTI